MLIFSPEFWPWVKYDKGCNAWHIAHHCREEVVCRIPHLCEQKAAPLPGFHIHCIPGLGLVQLWYRVAMLHTEYLYELSSHTRFLVVCSLIHYGKRLSVVNGIVFLEAWYFIAFVLIRREREGVSKWERGNIYCRTLKKGDKCHIHLHSWCLGWII